ncbi:MAG: hypothetical protein N4A47_03090 [Clostridia bacterium]|jgi:hypothetical protein|nr:hypothetical protein [Clostridia bacterium]
MDKSKFHAIFSIIVGDLVEKITITLQLSDRNAITELYSSRLYELLENEETKFWQYSTEKLFEMFLEERDTGKITFPEV